MEYLKRYLMHYFFPLQVVRVLILLLVFGQELFSRTYSKSGDYFLDFAVIIFFSIPLVLFIDFPILLLIERRRQTKQTIRPRHLFLYPLLGMLLGFALSFTIATLIALIPQVYQLRFTPSP